MFEQVWPTISISKIKIIASSLCLIGLVVAGSGLLKLQQVAAHDYQLKPVMTECSSTETEQQLFVDVGGAVAEPGLYQFAPGQRVGDALQAAGGVTQEADSNFVASQLNGAAPLNDGDKIFVPLEGQGSGETDDLLVSGDNENKSKASLISINQASATELATLPQIGEKRAEDIIAGRPYNSVEELLKKEVVSESVYSKIAELITL